MASPTETPIPAELKSSLEDSPGQALREKQRLLNQGRRSYGKSEQLETPTARFQEWKDAMKTLLEEEEERHTSKVADLQSKLTKARASGADGDPDTDVTDPAEPLRRPMQTSSLARAPEEQPGPAGSGRRISEAYGADSELLGFQAEGPYCACPISGDSTATAFATTTLLCSSGRLASSPQLPKPSKASPTAEMKSKLVFALAEHKDSKVNRAQKPLKQQAKVPPQAGKQEVFALDGPLSEALEPVLFSSVVSDGGSADPRLTSALMGLPSLLDFGCNPFDTSQGSEIALDFASLPRSPLCFLLIRCRGRTVSLLKMTSCSLDHLMTRICSIGMVYLTWCQTIASR